ncbi:MAG: prolipoprotein diacylglyceryl transferase [Candidatus Promineifilaceae bacterium]|nr:prolipoprotein diacylglyceryl transferase [Candidatus Promineifilaceae bacterium]
MTREKTYRRFRPGEIEPYWYAIVLFLLAGATLYVRHLATGQTPDRVAFSIDALNISVYWYGILITTGILLGAYVVSRLARDRARDVLRDTVPGEVRQRPVNALGLPAELRDLVHKQGIETLGDLLLPWGFGREELRLNEEGASVLRERLEAHASVKREWIDDPPWARWDPAHVWSGVIWALIFAVVGARLYHVLTPPPSMAELGIESPMDYFRHPLQLINVRRGGLGIYGGIAGGALGLLIYSYRQRISALGWADLGVVGVALGQFVGRWGNFFNQELYGRPTDVPWALHIEPAYRLDGYTQFERFHPAFLYESLWNLFAFLILLTLARRYKDRLQTGDLTAAYLILYAVGRTLLEQVRLDSATLGLFGIDVGMSVATAVSLLIAIAMGSWLLYRHVV